MMLPAQAAIRQATRVPDFPKDKPPQHQQGIGNFIRRVGRSVWPITTLE